MWWFGKLLLPVVVVALALGGAGYLRATRPMVEPEPVVEKVWNVRATEVRFADHQPVLELFGELVAMRERTLEAPVAGRVIHVAPELVDGGRVAAGTVLVRLDPFVYEAVLRERETERLELAANRAEVELNQRAQADLLEFARQRLARRRAGPARSRRHHRQGAGHRTGAGRAGGDRQGGQGLRPLGAADRRGRAGDSLRAA